MFDSTKNGMSADSSLASIFGLNPKENTTQGNLFGPLRPFSMVSDYSNMGVVSDEDTSKQMLDAGSLCERLEKLGDSSRSPTPKAEKQRQGSETPIDFETIEKMLQQEIATASTSRARPPGAGHRRQKARSLRPLLIVDSINERPAGSPGMIRSRTSSTPSVLDSPSFRVPETPIDPDSELGRMMARYRELQTEAQKELDQSRVIWVDTAFSLDQVSGKLHALQT
jgi:hypothetical protein